MDMPVMKRLVLFRVQFDRHRRFRVVDVIKQQQFHPGAVF